jgi:hypothetical protein
MNIETDSSNTIPSRKDIDIAVETLCCLYKQNKVYDVLNELIRTKRASEVISQLMMTQIHQAALGVEMSGISPKVTLTLQEPIPKVIIYDEIIEPFPKLTICCEGFHFERIQVAATLFLASETLTPISKLKKNFAKVSNDGESCFYQLMIDGMGRPDNEKYILKFVLLGLENNEWKIITGSEVFSNVFEATRRSGLSSISDRSFEMKLPNKLPSKWITNKYINPKPSISIRMKDQKAPLQTYGMRVDLVRSDDRNAVITDGLNGINFVSFNLNGKHEVEVIFRKLRIMTTSYMKQSNFCLRFILSEKGPNQSWIAIPGCIIFSNPITTYSTSTGLRKAIETEI